MTDERQEPAIHADPGTPETSPRPDTPGAQAHTGNAYPEAFDEELFLLYVGPRSDKFLRLYRARKQGKTPLSFNWAAFFVGLLWFYYRKLYFVGVCVLLIPVVL
ncbi:MAG: DUF2628 domain-containing protein, partial [Pseudomonadota bacterium]